MSGTNRKLIAVAVTGVFAMPLMAQAQSNVTISGRLYPEIVNAKVSGATPAGTPAAAMSTLTAVPATTAADQSGLSMDSPNSRLRISGKEDLGGGTKAIFQLEMGFGVDDGTNSSSTAGALFSRNTFVGMTGSFGTVKLGSMDTVYKEIGDTLSLLGVTSGNFMSASNILSKTGFGTGSSASSFHLRRGNSIWYETPETKGFTGLFDYSLGEVPGSNSAGRVMSMGMQYEGERLYLALAHEIHDNLFGLSRSLASKLRSTTLNPAATSKDKGTRLTAQYKFSKEDRVEFNFANMSFDEQGGAVGTAASYKHNSWAIIGEHKIKNVTLVGSYGQASAGSCAMVGNVACNTTGLDGKMFNIGAGYVFSKRTTLFAFYTKMINGNSAVYTNIGNGNLANGGKPFTGQDISTVAVGIKHDY